MIEFLSKLKLNFPIIFDGIKSFIYAWVPSIILLWFLISRRESTKIALPVLGFALGAGLTPFVAKLNELINQHYSHIEESFIFFSLSAINEELSKLIALTLALIIGWVFYNIIKKEKAGPSELIASNHLAYILAPAIGFAFAENFSYGMSGEGSIARILPLFAHCLFTYFSGVGIYLALINKNWLSKILSIPLGFMIAASIHILYNLSVSNEPPPPEIVRLIAFYIAPLIIILVIYLLNQHIKNLLPSVPDSTEQPTGELPPLPASMTISLFAPGLAHWKYRKEFFNGLTFFTLSLCLPLALLLALVTYFQDVAIMPNNEINKPLIAGILISVMASYLIVALWSGWEACQKAKTLAENSSKKRLSAILPLSLLLLCSLVISLYLPVKKLMEFNPETSDDPPNSVIKEIPIGLDWEVEEIIIKSVETEDKEDKESPEDDQESDISLEKEIQKLMPEKGKGIKNSQNTESLTVDEVPEQGYIGVQLSEIVIRGDKRPYVVHVYPGTSAERVGLRANDILLAVNGDDIGGMSLFQITKKVKGPHGTPVKLKILRLGVGTLEITAYRTGTIFNEGE